MEREAELIAKTDAALGGPVTREGIVSDLRKLGVLAGEILLVHSSLSALGWVCGGAETLIRALIEVLGSEGTLVMPAHSGDLSDPDLWEAPAVPETWRAVIRETMPVFDPQVTRTRGIGAVSELFCRFPEVRRSSHPIDSFTALGPEAEFLTHCHPLEEGLGEGTPLGRLYERRARVLLVGCGYESNTSLHLAEHRADWPGKKTISQGCPVIDDKGRRVWQRFEELDYSTEDFAECGRAFESAIASREERRFHGAVVFGPVGMAECRLISQSLLVDFATGWFSQNRGAGIGGETGSA